MTATILTRVRPDRGVARKWLKLLFVASVVSMGGCVQVSAPDKPIEINLNINIKQEVVVRLQQDVQNLIKENPGVF